MTSWQKLVEPLALDRHQGASQLYRELLKKVQKYVSSHDPSTLQLADLAEKVAQVRPEMAPFHYAAHKIGALNTSPDMRELPQRLLYLLRELRDEVDKAAELISPLLRERVENCNAIMLHSYSGTLKDAVVSAVSTNVRILISEAEPGREGLRLARELRKKRYAVVTYPDEELANRISQVDAAIVGTDWIAEEFFVNKVGTGHIAQESQRCGRPFYVVSDFSKLVSSHHRPAQSREMGEELFESVSSSYVTEFLLPGKVCVPQEVAALL